MKEYKLKKKVSLSRKAIVFYCICIALLCGVAGVLLMGALSQSEVIQEALVTYHIDTSLVVILFTIFVEWLWLPLLIGSQRVFDLDDESMTLLPMMKTWDKWRIMFYVLCNDRIEPFLRKVRYDDIISGTFTVERKFGAWSFSRYSYRLDLHMAHTTLTLYINPMDNGPLLPSGKGGFVFSGYQSREDICNMIQFLRTRGIKLQDPHHLLDALADSQIEMYDYLEALQLHTKY